ncbi:MAG: hypothetical protein H0W96_06145 [Solirubrobacterales bacterium]|nr:hypothetical protein [Solirubrobacterales bacterium]
MPPSTFNNMEGNTEWDSLTNARAMYESSRGETDSSGAGMQSLLIIGGALLAAICIAIALLVG